MEVQPDIQQRSGLASSLGASSACLPDTGRMWLQLIQRSEPKVGQHCPRTDPPPPARHRHHPVCPPQADYVRRRVMRDGRRATIFTLLQRMTLNICYSQSCFSRDVEYRTTANYSKLERLGYPDEQSLICSI
jgi:hypothetical protein